MLSKKDLKRRFKIGHNTVYRTLQACPLGTKKKLYTEAEIQQYFVPARQMLKAGQTYQEVQQYFSRQGNSTADFLKSKEALGNSKEDDNTATVLPPIVMNNGCNSDNLSKRFRISYYTFQATARLAKVCKRESVISYSRLSPTIQNIHQLGGTILSVTELASIS